MMQKIDPSQLLSLSHTCPVIDVRTPAEFAQGHIPSAHNVPLFSNEERVIIGTAYKQQGKEQAMLIALEYIGPRMRLLIEQVQALAPKDLSKKIIVHCWRGGMRSASFAWLLNFFGYEVFLLEGGYKAFRAFARAVLQEQKQIQIVSGPTGSGKTKLLQKMHSDGEQVLDLEGLAQHKGSVFGGLEKRTQPTQEQFENDLACAWARFDAQKMVWIEDESKKIGTVYIPEPLWEQMRQAPLKHLTVSREERLQNLLAEYGCFSIEDLVACTLRLEKYLGGARTQEIVAALHENNLHGACEILVAYYDTTYAYSLSKRTQENLCL